MSKPRKVLVKASMLRKAARIITEQQKLLEKMAAFLAVTPTRSETKNSWVH